ncbi:unnamed protein product [Chironomus riparius]|uniref:Uncharacterized protein n=1 Tax=Chironomus riparius TaxID=315576 RepID=A0A9N9RHR0_9DIPT|nr:unnamed protein product [Chironomus riparius]
MNKVILLTFLVVAFVAVISEAKGTKAPKQEGEGGGTEPTGDSIPKGPKRQGGGKGGKRSKPTKSLPVSPGEK